MSDISDDESDWVSAIDGDGDAFSRLFDRYRIQVARYSYRLVPFPADAEDVVAMVFLEAWRRRTHVRFVNGSVLPWLLVTAANVARNVTRSARRHRSFLDKLPPQENAPDHFEVEGDSDAERVLRSLSIVDQQVITLCILEGFSEKEAAMALSVPVGTIKSRLSRAKARMAARLERPNIQTARLERRTS